MRPEAPGTRSARSRHGLARLLAVCGLAALGGCRFLADEFSWYDRQAPSARAVPDAPVPGLAGQP